MTQNDLDQPIGAALPGWRGAAAPPRTAMAGRYCRVEPIDPDRHGAALFDANREDADNRIWTYLPYGPFADQPAYRAWLEKFCLGDDPLYHAVIDLGTGKAAGVASYLRIEPAVGVI